MKQLSEKFRQFIEFCILDNDARSRQDLSVYKSMLDRIKHDEESRNNTTSPIFQLQDSDIRYIVRSFWDSRSILSGLSNMYELRLIRWIHDEEWSPWNCVLLTHNEADIHGQLSNLFKVRIRDCFQKILFMQRGQALSKHSIVLKQLPNCLRWKSKSLVYFPPRRDRNALKVIFSWP